MIFKDVILRQAVDLLRGKGLEPEEADEWRARLLAGFRWILVDEYQDIGPDQYAADIGSSGSERLPNAGRQTEPIFAVGDDDQNIYAFNGSSTLNSFNGSRTDYGTPNPRFWYRQLPLLRPTSSRPSNAVIANRRGSG